MIKSIDSKSFYTKFLSGELQHLRNYGVVTIEPAGQANGWKVTIVDDNYEIAGGTELAIGGETLCSTARIALKPGHEGRKVMTYRFDHPVGKGPTFFALDDAIAEANSHICEEHADYPLDEAKQRAQVAALKPDESVRWEIEGDEYFIHCKEMTVEELEEMPEFNGY